MDRVKRIMIILSAVTLCALILSAVILSGAGPWTIGLFVLLFAAVAGCLVESRYELAALLSLWTNPEAWRWK